MGDADVRTLVLKATQNSKYREGKLGFRGFTDGPGSQLLEVMAAKSGGFDRETLTRYRDSGVDLELYLPMPDHRSRWRGGTDLIVATSLNDHEPPIAFDLTGNEITGLSSEAPPGVPTLALVPVETNFDEPPVSSAELAGAMVEPNGLYITHVNLKNTGEGWLRGSPEIEAMLMGPVKDTMTLAKIDCANESRIGARFYNQDDNDWTGKVLVADSLQLAAIKSKYPAGTPWDKVRYTVEFWEDDTERCVIATDKNNWKTLMGSTILTVVGGLAWISHDWTKNIEDEEWPFIAALPLGTLALIQTIGGNDEKLGATISASVWNPKHTSDQVSESHAAVVGSNRNGRATLIWGVPPPPPPPYAVTVIAPSHVATKGTYTLTGSANYPSYNWKWEKSTDGGTTWTTHATTQNSSFFVSAGQQMTINWRLSATRTADHVVDFGGATTTVCTVSTGCELQ